MKKHRSDNKVRHWLGESRGETYFLGVKAGVKADGAEPLDARWIGQASPWLPASLFERFWISALAFVLMCSWPTFGVAQETPADAATATATRQGYLVDVELPLVGDRDERVKQQILKIASSESQSEQRPVVVLRFKGTVLSEIGGEPDNGGMGTRGSQFERCLSLARFLTSSDAARVRLVAFVPETVEGHAVLPVLACEDILATQTAELGRASIDEPADATVTSAYRDMVTRRASLPEAVALAMLDPATEVYELELTDGSVQTVDRPAAEKLRDAGQVVREETIWSGGGLASFNGRQLRARKWIARTVADEFEAAETLGLSRSLRSSKQLPREWKPVTVTLSGSLSGTRVNQILRSLGEKIREREVNLVVFDVEQTKCDFQQAARLASFIAEQDAEQVYSLGIIRESLAGASALIPIACRECVVLRGAELSADAEAREPITGDNAVARVLADLSARSGRPVSLMSVVVDADVVVQEFVNQDNGKSQIFANWQVAAQADADQWLARATVASDGRVSAEVAMQYRLVDSIEDSAATVLARLGVEEQPPELSTPWLDAMIQMLLAQGWLPRLLLTVGFFALMAELSSPGMGVGGFLSAVCFLGFFWIEGLNGNVEALEVILFAAGLVALALELFVVPGFGVFGIGGLLMLLVSVVLASQTFIWPTTSAQLNEVAVNLFWVACLALCGMIGLLFMHKQIERLPLLSWVTLRPEEDIEDLDRRESLTHREHLLGQDGLTTTRLNPSGKAQFGSDVVAVVGTGRMIDAGVPVRVVEVRGNLVLVEELSS